MKNVDKIMHHPLYISSMKKIEDMEKDRIFCRHGMEHCLDVARIACIEALRQKLDLSMDLIYSAALLHDIGRGQEYESGLSHEQAGWQISSRILEDTDFDEEEKKQILQAVLSHRRSDGCRQDLTGLLQKADHTSRLCFLCSAWEQCNWCNEDKNSTIEL